MRKMRNSLTGYAKDEEQVWLLHQLPQAGMQIGYSADVLLHYEQSPVHEISVMENQIFGRMLVLDGTPHATANDGFIYNEMIAHIPMTTHKQPKRAAVIGAGGCGAVREVLKYQEVERVDAVEVDRRVTEICGKWWSPRQKRDDRLRITYQDGAEWIGNQHGSYDVLLVDRFVPYGPAYGLYKPAFYQHAFNSLTDEGVAVFSSCSPYFHATIFRDTVEQLQKLFPIVRIYLAIIPSYPGGLCSFALGSKKWDPLQAQINRLRAEETRYLNSELYQAAFALPNHVKQLLPGERGETGEEA